MKLEIDWATIGAWIGAAGGLSGFFSLAATWLWRRQDQRKQETDRLTLVDVQGGDYGMSFWVKYDSAVPNEGLRVEVKVLEGNANRGPFTEDYRQSAYDPSQGTTVQLPPNRRERRHEDRLSQWPGDPPGVLAAWFVLHGDPRPTKCKIKVVVRGAASRNILVRRTCYLAAQV
jgi:hypothetical protein